MKTYSKLKISKGNISAVLITASLFVAPSAIAQKGMWEMSIAGNIENKSSTTTTTFGSSTQDQTQTYVNANVGRYFTPKLVGRINLSMFGSDSGASSSLGTAVGAGVKFYFGEAAKSKWVPFVEGGVNIVMLSMTSPAPVGTTNAYGAGIVGGGGVSHFLTEDVSIDLSGQIFYDSLTIDTTGSPTMENSGQRILFGITARY